MQRGSKTGLGILLACALLALILVINKQRITDQILFWQFTPTQEIQQLASQSSLSENGKFYLYVTHPQIKSKDEFGTVCENRDPSTSILGCYVNDRVYIYNVSNPELHGIQAVTAAHEMLHAVYVRLGATEKANINRELDAAYEGLKDRNDLKERMAVYAKTEPGERDNELHSVLGTEVQNLPESLEKYYRQYFNDRSKLIAVHAAYQHVFTSLQNKAKTLEQELTNLQVTIENDKKTYEQNLATTNNAIADFNSSASTGGFRSQAAFAQARAELVRQVEELDALRSSINSSIEMFNAKNTELASLDTQAKRLNQSIDSRLPEAPRL